MKAAISTKQAIFNAAVDMFSKESYHHVSMRQIADTVGINPSSIYNHYESKEAILQDIYRYFDDTMDRLSPDLEKLLALVPTEHPYDVLRMTTMIYPADIRPVMAKAMLVTTSMIWSDPKADYLVNKNLIEMPSRYDIPLLEKMMELNRIEPINAENFTLLHSSYCYSAAVRFYTNHMIDNETWLEGLDMLFKLVRVK